MNPLQEDPIVHMRRLLPFGPSFNSAGPKTSQVVIPFGVRYAVPPGIITVGKNGPTKGPKVSINQPTSPDGGPFNTPQQDDVDVESTD